MGHLSRQGVMVAGVLGAVLLGGYWLMRPSGDNAPSPEVGGGDVPVQSIAGDGSRVDIQTYMRWLRDGDPRRAQWIESQIARRGEGWMRHNSEPFPSLDLSDEAVKHLKVEHVHLAQAEGGPVDFWLLTWPQYLPGDKEHGLISGYALAIEVFSDRGQGLSLASRHLFADLPCEGPAQVKSWMPIVVADRWLFLEIDEHEGGQGTGMAGSTFSWYQATEDGLSPVWYRDRWSHDANTTIWVESGTIESRIAVLNGRPAIFEDRYKLLVPSEIVDDEDDAADRGTLTETVAYRGMAVWRQAHDHEPFAIDSDFSSMSEEQAASAAVTGNRQSLFEDKTASGIRNRTPTRLEFE